MTRVVCVMVMALACNHIDPTTLIPCGDHCRSIPESAVGDDLRPKLAPTTPAMICVPDRNIIEDKYIPLKCNSVNGLEGRCLAKCIPAVAPNVIFLSQDICWAGEVCAPCYNPLTGLLTGACNVGTDTPTMMP